jgi:nucleotide-binding universal stress UspA family protein
MLATDGSPDATAAAGWLANLPLPREVTLLVISVVTLPPSAIHFPAIDELNASIVAEARRAAEDAQAVLRTRWPAVEMRVPTGDPREQILGVAAEWKPDLAVFGRRGLGGFARALLGSVSLTAARHLGGAVLVTRGTPRPIRRVVVGVDGSDDSLHALRLLETLPLGPATEVCLLAVGDTIRLPRHVPAFVRDSLKAATADLEAKQTADLRALLEQAVGRLAREGRTELRPVLGQPAEAIITAASEGKGADLVVVGHRGLGPVRRLLLGTVSETVLAHAPCPVLIVKR